MNQIIFGCQAVDRFKQPDKMKFGEIRLLSNIVEIDAVGVKLIDK